MSFDKETLRKRIEASNFIENNGTVIRTINHLHCVYNKLKTIKSVLNMELDEIVDSVNYLYEEGYIHLRHIDSKEAASLADTNFSDLEAKLTAKGIRFIAGKIKDDCIDL